MERYSTGPDGPPGQSRPRRVPAWLAAVVALCLGGACILQSAWVERVTGYAWLTDHTHGLVDEALDKNQTAFLLISGVKAGLAVVEASTVGVGVNIQVGDIVQSVYDYVDFIWKMFLYALLLMGLYKLLLSTGMLSMGIPILGVSLCLWGLATILMGGQQGRILRDMSRLLLVVGLSLLYVLPLALITANQVHVRYTAQLKAEKRQQLEAFVQEFDTLKTEFLGLRHQLSITSPAESLTRLKDELVAMINRMVTNVYDVTGALMFYAVLVLFDVLFAPLAVGFLLLRMIGRLADRVLPFGGPVHAPVRSAA